MSKLIDFKDSSSDIKNRLLFPLTEVQINHCLQDLEDLNLIKCDSGIRKATKDHIKTPTDLADEGLKLFHEQMISNAKSSIRLVKPEKRDIQGTTLNIKLENLPKAKKLIQDFLNEFEGIVETEAGDETYQLNVQFFPLTHSEIKDHK